MRVRRTSHVRWPTQAPDGAAAARIQAGRHDDHAGRFVGADAQGAHDQRHPADIGRRQPPQ